MKPTTWRICLGSARTVPGLCVLGLTWALTLAGAVAQDLVVVLSSAQDEASADKLAELIREPFQRVDVASLQIPPPTAAGACRTQARLELSLDSAGQAVRLVRCRDATVLARGLDPEAARETPYLSAFVAAELLAINRELEAVEARSAAGQVASPAPPSPTSAAVSGSVPEPRPLEPVPSALALHARVGAELTLWGAPFDHVVRPCFGLGLSIAPHTPDFAWVFEVSAGLFAAAEAQRATESLELQRHDGQLQGGVRFALGPLQLAGFAFARASLTRAQYNSAVVANSSHQLRLGVGAGVEADMPLSAAFAVYTQAKLDVATSRSEYRVPGSSWLRDPASLFWVGVGLLVRLYP